MVSRFGKSPKCRHDIFLELFIRSSSYEIRVEVSFDFFRAFLCDVLHSSEELLFRYLLVAHTIIVE